LGFKVAVVQPAVTNSVNRNLQKIDELLAEAGKHSPDLALLPETWQHSNVFAVAGHLAGKVDDVLRILAKHASEFGMVVAGGGVVVRREKGLMNSCPVVGPDGEVWGWQDKIHLYRGEKQHFVRGDGVRVFSFRGVGFGVLICHDIVFPELGRLMALKGADVLLNPSRMPSSGVEPWHDYVKSRCLENRVAAATSNVCVNTSTCGGTAVFTLERANSYMFRVRKTTLNEVEDVLAVEINGFEEMRKARRERLAHRLPSLYREIVEENYSNPVIMK